MSDFDRFTNEHQQEFPDCREPLYAGRCKCGNARVYICAPHDRVYAISTCACIVGRRRLEP